MVFFLSTTMSLLRSQKKYHYTRIEKEDPEEEKDRRAQFLIYKTLEAANPHRQIQSSMGLRVHKMMKVKVGRKFMRRLRRKVQITFSGLHLQVKRQLKLWKLVGSLPRLTGA